MKKIKQLKFIIISMMITLWTNPILVSAAKKKSTCSGDNETDACKSIVSCMDTKIPKTVHTIILAIQIIVPILLVIFGMIDLIKAVVAGKEDEIKKAQGVFVKRLIAGALVFFVIAIVKLLISLTGDFDGGMTDCVNAFVNGDY